MSIQSEITRISGNVSNAFTAITNKGVTVPAGSTSDDLADLIGQITGGGGGGAISIVDTPDAAGGTVRTITAVDISDTTAVAGDVAQGKYFYTADGTKTAGTASGGGATLITKNITANGTYNASSDNADGYSSVTVNVSGGGSVSPKQINFVDYDGTILYSYTAQEANALSALPANPSHSGLTAQGWNWTLAQIKAQLTAMPDGPVWVGQMYVTQSGDTELDLRFTDAARLSPILTIAVNGTVTVDWGDNIAADTVTGSSLTTRQAVPHTYAAPGDYMMKIHVVSGSFTFYGSSSYTILRKNTTGNENRVYANCIQAIRLGSGITSIGNNAFTYCSSLASIAIPSSVTSIGNNAFSYCNRFASVTIPSNVTSIGGSAFYNCYSLASITIPSGVTSIGNGAFTYCYGVAEYHIKPTSVPTGGTTMFASIVSDCVIYVPSAKLNDYKTAENWSAYASYMQGE